MTDLSFVWVHPYSRNRRCDIHMPPRKIHMPPGQIHMLLGWIHMI